MNQRIFIEIDVSGELPPLVEDIVQEIIEEALLKSDKFQAEVWSVAVIDVKEI